MKLFWGGHTLATNSGNCVVFVLLKFHSCIGYSGSCHFTFGAVGGYQGHRTGVVQVLLSRENLLYQSW